MESISRNIILDLLPVYISGEASDETKKLVDEYAKADHEIAEIIRTGNLESEFTHSEISPPDDLEMKTIKRVRRGIRRQMWFVAIATASILMIPLVAMFFTNEVNWTLFDFIVMGILLLGSGLTYVLISRVSENIAYKAAVGIAVAAGLLLIWINLAVGIIGSEDNPANLLYFAVIAVGIVGAFITRFKPLGMARAMFITAISQMFVPFIAMIFWSKTLQSNPGFVGILMLTGFFAAMFAVSGLLFRYAGKGST